MSLWGLSEYGTFEGTILWWNAGPLSQSALGFFLSSYKCGLWKGKEEDPLYGGSYTGSHLALYFNRHEPELYNVNSL